MHRFYIPTPDIRKNILEVTDPRIVFQCSKVLRMRPGSPFSVFGNDEKEVSVELIEIDRKHLLANVVEELKRDPESKIEVHLYQAMPKKPALLELVIQKATEIGVSHIYPLVTRRTERQHVGRFDRLSMIAIEATEQSGRLRVPTLHHPVNFDEAVGLGNAYVAYEYEGKTSLMSFVPEIRKAKIARLFIGPEGGFDQKEIDEAIAKGAKPFSMGPRILRTETAAISAASLVLLS
ncbi:16S rRNA (uracil(1498)-N(3))-methyltransferase [Candidatus Peregrinibacteria bacterium]|nr:16S rRNA (uracil(1498)-N(3))-methyltransferase [Candidatus Peregrinibacteria bacterium]